MQFSIKRDKFLESLNYVQGIVEKKNTLLSDKIDLDFLEIIYREKFMVGKSKEQIYIDN